MAGKKRSRTAYSKLSQEEKDAKNARRRQQWSDLSQAKKDAKNARRRELRLLKKQPTNVAVQISPDEKDVAADLEPTQMVGEESITAGTLQQIHDPFKKLLSKAAHSTYELGETSNPPSKATIRKSEKDPKKKVNKRIHASKENNFRHHKVPTESYKLPSVAVCKFCFAKRFPYEPDGFCCSKGEVQLYSVSIPDALSELYHGQTDDSKHFRQYIRPYNNEFAFTSFGVGKLDEKYATKTKGIYTFRAQGQAYHYINSLYPREDAAPSHLQLYFYDTDNEIKNRMGRKDELQKNIVTLLVEILHANPYSRFFRSLNEIPNLDNHEIRIRADPILDTGTLSAPSSSQVAAIWSENEDRSGLKTRDILVHKYDGHSQRIKSYFGCYDSLQYPLLFPLGEPGWHQGIKKISRKGLGSFSAGQEAVLPIHYATTEDLLAAESSVFEENCTKGNMVSAREFYAYRLQIRESINSIILQSGRLLQQFAVDMYIKIETSRLDYFRNKQDEIRADLYQGIMDSINKGESKGSKIGKRIVLPGSFIGGPRDMRKRYLDAMTLVEKYGKPDIFFTMTCNPKWTEIVTELQPYEEAHNRPDLITRIFKSKLEQLKKEVIKKQLFGPVAAYTYVIEFQKRGLPHVHLLLILKKEYKLDNAEKFDSFILAELPGKAKYPHLYSMVVKHMMHGPCGQLKPDNVCMKKEKCKNKYPRNYTSETIVGMDGYPIYRRRQDNQTVKVHGQILDNRWVVPYNPYLLAMFDCHINVEVCSTIKAVKYLYKYIYKGHDKVVYQIVSPQNHEDYDEITRFQSARWVSPPEAMWRIYRLYETICSKSPAAFGTLPNSQLQKRIHIKLY